MRSALTVATRSLLQHLPEVSLGRLRWALVARPFWGGCGSCAARALAAAGGDGWLRAGGGVSEVRTARLARRSQSSTDVLLGAGGVRAMRP